jgi:hypothetical protein
MIWRQQLSFKALAENYGQEQVVQAVHPRAKKAVNQIYKENLDKYMQWFPWSWFSNMQFIGAGGFSAVYSVHMTPAYDPNPLNMALKIVDDKLLNEVNKPFVLCIKKRILSYIFRFLFNQKPFYLYYFKALLFVKVQEI